MVYVKNFFSRIVKINISRIVIFTILEASKAQVKTLQNHDVIRLMKIILKRVKRILSIQKKQMR